MATTLPAALSSSLHVILKPSLTSKPIFKTKAFPLLRSITSKTDFNITFAPPLKPKTPNPKPSSSSPAVPLLIPWIVRGEDGQLKLQSTPPTQLLHDMANAKTTSTSPKKQKKKKKMDTSPVLTSEPKYSKAARRFYNENFRDPPQRLSKLLAAAGVASRRSSEELIFGGKVTVNGSVCNTPQTRVDPGRDIIYVNGNRISKKLPPKVYLALNKPKGYICSSGEKETKSVMSLLDDYLKSWVKVNVDGASFGNPRESVWGATLRDSEGQFLLSCTKAIQAFASRNHGNFGLDGVCTSVWLRPDGEQSMICPRPWPHSPTIISACTHPYWPDPNMNRINPGTPKPRLFTVGRLDVATTGLIIITNDGRRFRSKNFTSFFWLIKGVRYIAAVDGTVNKRHLTSISEGTIIEGVHCRPDSVELLRQQPDMSRPRLRIVVHEGRNHEVRELVKNAGLMLHSLKRVRIGGFRLPSDLGLGKHVELKQGDLKSLGGKT
ncbi:hypothetical protein IFM89_010661 [Coptis chinensis]|uniref:RNA-binding S4 domain-containing protein n=1 Tax=Coptis chinensis TaxID=261450 RepID=A0A835HDK6_9MAGN|nr:hypothetical protein IFM89_010661 [Coptis chinensis]